MAKDVFDYSKLKGKITEKFGTQSSFVEKINMSIPTFIKKLNGDGWFSQEEISEIMTILELNIEEEYEYFFVKKVRNS